MAEFNNRIAAQRTILRIVNRKNWGAEELFGLSADAIKRWRDINHIEPSSRIAKLVIAASERLYFLANKSQEQVTPEYKSASIEISDIAKEIEILI